MATTRLQTKKAKDGKSPAVSHNLDSEENASQQLRLARAHAYLCTADESANTQSQKTIPSTPSKVEKPKPKTKPKPAKTPKEPAKSINPEAAPKPSKAKLDKPPASSKTPTSSKTSAPGTTPAPSKTPAPGRTSEKAHVAKPELFPNLGRGTYDADQDSIWLYNWYLRRWQARANGASTSQLEEKRISWKLTRNTAKKLKPRKRHEWVAPKITWPHSKTVGALLGYYEGTPKKLSRVEYDH